MAEPAEQVQVQMLSFGGEGEQPVYQIVREKAVPGHLKISAAGMAFKGKDGKKPPPVQKSDMSSLRWLRVGRGHQLKLNLKGGNTVIFDGFKNTERDKIREFFTANFDDVEQDTEEPAVIGWNWGELELSGSTLRYMVQGKVAFEVPIPAVEKAQGSRHETSIEFAVDPNDRMLQQVESMRFHFTQHPDDLTRESDKTRPEEMASMISDKISGDALTGSIAKFDEVMLMQPRGKYSFEFFPTAVQLHGKSVDFKIAYTSIKRLFLLQVPDRPAKYLVMHLDPPLRHNLKKHHILTFSINEGLIVEVDINKPDVENIPERLDEMKETEEGEQVEILARLLKLLSKAKLLSAGRFRSRYGNEAVKCSVKNVHDGSLYFMEKALLFLFKFPTYLRYDEVASVSFERIKAAESLTRSFDLEITTKSGGDAIKFTSISKDELESIRDFVREKNLNVTTLEEELDNKFSDNEMYDEDDDDDDAYMRQMKKQGGQDDSDDSEEDGDYEMGEESSIDEEYDEDEDADIDAAPKERTQASGSGATKKRKKKKDPAAPKKPLSAYMLYCASARADAQSANEGSSMGEISKVLGAQWQKLPDEEKAPFEEEAQSLREKYLIEKEKYDEEHANDPSDDDDDSSSSKRKKKKKNAGPKKPKSAYMCFAPTVRAEIVAENEGAKPTEIMKLIAERWKALDGEGRAEFEALAEKDKERYQTEFEEFRLREIAEGKDDPLKGKRKRGDPDAPKKNLSAYMHFCNQARAEVTEENPDAKGKEVMVLLGAKWKEMSASDREQYETLAAEDKTRYDEALKKYYEDHPEKKAAAEAAKARKKPAAKSVSKGQTKLSQMFKSADTLNSSDDVDSDDDLSIQAMMSKKK